jgi:tRNA 5-methylaminomethyl-2-thiouridine biosynthesis bifunctional protein
LKRPTLSPHPPLQFDDSGAPLSALYGDIFRSRAGALEESRQVFVEGVRVAESAQDQSVFTVLEIGFGLGVNFLATLETWLQAAPAAARLHFVAIEKHPLAVVDLERAHDALHLDSPWARHLRAHWPPATPDLHQLQFAGGRVLLWLALGDAADWLPQLRLAADAVYLDGFAPARNPECWAPALLKGVARHCRRGARLATYSAARPVRDALSAVGFEVELVPGFRHKRHRIAAVYAPKWRTWPEPAAAPRCPSREALVIGAGLAGTAVAARLAELGWSATLIDQGNALMGGGSGQPICSDHLHVSIDDNLTARASRAALFLARANRARLPGVLRQPPIGRLQIPDGSEECERMRACVRALGFPSSLLAWVERDQASTIAGERLASGGLWMPGCDLIEPTVLGRARLVAGGDRLRVIASVRVEALQWRDDVWTALGAGGQRIAAAPVVILCNAGDLNRLADLRCLSLRPVRGQTSWLDPSPLPALRCVLGGPAYAAPSNGRLLIGATFDEQDHIEPDRDSDLSNLKRFARMLGRDASGLEPTLSSAVVGTRWASIDRLPLIGALPDEPAARSQAEPLLRNAKLALPRRPGLYCIAGLGSRGSLWSELGAEMVAAGLEGSPSPVPLDLAEALDPARHLRRELRHHLSPHRLP